MGRGGRPGARARLATKGAGKCDQGGSGREGPEKPPPCDSCSKSPSARLFAQIRPLVSRQHRKGVGARPAPLPTSGSHEDLRPRPTFAPSKSFSGPELLTREHTLARIGPVKRDLPRKAGDLQGLSAGRPGLSGTPAEMLTSGGVSRSVPKCLQRGCTSLQTSLAFCLRLRLEEILVALGKEVLLTVRFENVVEVVGIRGVQRGQE